MFIREYNGHKYRIYTANSNKTVIAVSSFAGKTVKGIAKANPTDTFDLEKGINLAIRRCDVKICEKKVKKAFEKIDNAEKATALAVKTHEKAKNYFEDAEKAFNEATFEMENYLSTL